MREVVEDVWTFQDLGIFIAIGIAILFFILREAQKRNADPEKYEPLARLLILVLAVISILWIVSIWPSSEVHSAPEEEPVMITDP